MKVLIYVNIVVPLCALTIVRRDTSRGEMAVLKGKNDENSKDCFIDSIYV